MEHSIVRAARRPLILGVVLLAACGDDDLESRVTASVRAAATVRPTAAATAAPATTTSAPGQGVGAAATQPRTAAPTTTTTTTAAAPLAISGAAPQFIVVDENYRFAPAASSTSGAALTFAVTSRPAWLSFDSGSGTLSGSPTAADIGLYRGIGIQVSDGSRTAQLAPFDIEVVATGTRTATVAWQMPTENEDGSPLSDLAGFQINYGRQSGDYTHNVDVPNPGVATYVVSGLVPGTYYFTMTAYNDVDVDSTASPEMTIVIR
jgi:hypothetical protein